MKSIKIGKSDLIDIDYIDQSVEIDDTLVSFIDLSRFYRFHRFISEDTSVLLFIQKWKLILGQANCEFVDNWAAIESRRIKQFVITFLKKKLKKKTALKPALKSFSDSRYWPGL